MSDLSGAKNWNCIGSGDKFAPGLRMSGSRPRRPRCDFGLSDDAGVPVPDLDPDPDATEPARRGGGSGYTTPTGIGASSYRAARGLPVLVRDPRGGTGSGTGMGPFSGIGRREVWYACGVGMGSTSFIGTGRGLLGGGIGTGVFEGTGSGLDGGGTGIGVFEGTGIGLASSVLDG